MNPLEKELSYPFGDQLPAPATLLEVAPGLKWLRMPLPFALDHINLWLLRDTVEGREGWSVIDCGVARPEVMALWEQVFASALDGLPIVRVIVTHMHPDHIGLADWLTRRFQAPLHMSATDFLTAHLHVCGQIVGTAQGMADHFARHGVTDPDVLASIRQRTHYFKELVPSVPPTFHQIQDGDLLTIGAHTWQAISGYGHAPEHLAFYSVGLGVLISGDMVLPRISTNVTVHDTHPEANPLQRYLHSLDRYLALPADTLVLPSHGRPFTGLHRRIQQQHTHHKTQLDQVKQACQTPSTAYDMLPILFRRQLDLHQLTFAMGEAIAHLHMLYYQGELARTQDSDGIFRFQAA